MDSSNIVDSDKDKGVEAGIVEKKVADEAEADGGEGEAMG